MAKKAGFPATVDDRTKDGALSKHVGELTGHLLDSADYNQHGHVVGKQGAKGHAMVPSDAHKQDGAHMPQNAFSDSGSGDADCPATFDYGRGEAR